MDVIVLLFYSVGTVISTASTAVAVVIVFNGNIAVMSLSRITVNKTSVSSSAHTHLLQINWSHDHPCHLR